MKATIPKNALMVPLYRAQGVIDRKSSTNVLSCVHAEARDGLITFRATDYEVTITAQAEAEILEPGAALVNGKALFDIVRALPDGSMVTISSGENHRMRVEAGRAYYHLYGMAPEEFPEVEEEEAGSSLELDKVDLNAMLRRTLFSVSLDESRPVLNGILFEIEEAGSGQVRARMVSTDGHRLSRVERLLAAKDHDGSRHRSILHRRGATELQRILEGSDPVVRIVFLERTLVFRSDQARLQVRQIEETFPEYERVIPAQSDVSASLPKEALLAAIRRVSSLGTGKNSLLRFDLEAGRASLEMTHHDFGEAHEEIEVPDYAGQSVSMGFNPRYIVDVLSVLESDLVTLDLSDQFSPCLIGSPEEPGATFVVMPMRL
jgi:DNA polymerase-3 subunit beta